MLYALEDSPVFTQHAQVDRFPNSKFKSFPTKSAAEDWLLSPEVVDLIVAPSGPGRRGEMELETTSPYFRNPSAVEQPTILRDGRSRPSPGGGRAADSNFEPIKLQRFWWLWRCGQQLRTFKATRPYPGESLPGNNREGTPRNAVCISRNTKPYSNWKICQRHCTRAQKTHHRTHARPKSCPTARS
ncbi:hypothetical protein BDD12DRAFT_382677 [Trichophaea hybrida]|nr:hypothetical protein BDD12DRAFT_382677 [Trichophaea hybrida]